MHNCHFILRQRQIFFKHVRVEGTFKKFVILLSKLTLSFLSSSFFFFLSSQMRYWHFIHKNRPVRYLQARAAYNQGREWYSGECRLT